MPRGLLGRSGEAFHGVVGNFSTKFLQFRVAAFEQLGGSHAVEAEDAVGMFAEAVAGSAGIDKLNIPVSAGQGDGSGGAGKTTADDDDV